jgi:hypothetical protein
MSRRSYDSIYYSNVCLDFRYRPLQRFASFVCGFPAADKSIFTLSNLSWEVVHPISKVFLPRTILSPEQTYLPPIDHVLPE